MARPTTMLSVLISLLIALFCVQSVVADEKSELLDTEKKQVSYALGYNVGKNLNTHYKIDKELFDKGYKDSQEGQSLITNDELIKSVKVFQNIVNKAQDEYLQAIILQNRADGDAFLLANREKEGVTTLPSGLQYKVLTEGEGDLPKATDSVTCHYKGTTIDGKEFDSSIKRGQPATFKVGGVIKGWTEALQLMKVGSKWMLYIPSDMAYGDRGAGKNIEPGATLVFEVELLSIAG